MKAWKTILLAGAVALTLALSATASRADVPLGVVIQDTPAGVIVTAEREGERLLTFGARPPVHTVPLAVPGPSEPPSGARFRQELVAGMVCHRSTVNG